MSGGHLAIYTTGGETQTIWFRARDGVITYGHWLLVNLYLLCLGALVRRRGEFGLDAVGSISTNSTHDLVGGSELTTYYRRLLAKLMELLWLKKDCAW
jgi:hypothetical protein